MGRLLIVFKNNLGKTEYLAMKLYQKRTNMQSDLLIKLKLLEV